MITLLKKTFVRDDGTPFAGLPVRVAREDNSPVRLYTRSGLLLSEQGYAATDVAGSLEVYVGDPGTFVVSVMNPEMTMEFSRDAVSTSDAARTEPRSRILAQSAVPRILPSSGSSNATGQITHTTALPYQPAGVVWIRLPAGVVTAGSAGTGAGLYPVIYSSTTVCQIQGTGIVTANAAYTQTTGSPIALATIPVPGGCMGPNGVLQYSSAFAYPNNANSKTLTGSFGGLSTHTSAFTTTVAAYPRKSIFNRNSQNSQFIPAPAQFPDGAAATGAPTYGSIDTSITQNLVLNAQLAVATDYVILEAHSVEVLALA
jgi:hypothetical protein